MNAPRVICCVCKVQYKDGDPSLKPSHGHCPSCHELKMAEVLAYAEKRRAEKAREAA